MSPLPWKVLKVRDQVRPWAIEADDGGEVARFSEEEDARSVVNSVNASVSQIDA